MSKYTESVSMEYLPLMTELKKETNVFLLNSQRQHTERKQWERLRIKE